MATTTRQFNIGLYLEHLDEASFLYQHRLAYLHDPEVNWPDLAQWEERFEAHIDALVVGEDLALEVCRRRVADGDAGEKHAALCVFCRQRRTDDVLAILEPVDPGDEDIVRAVANALRVEAPSEWQDDLLTLFDSDRPHLVPVLANVIGYRRFPGEELLLRKLVTRPTFGIADIAWALGRVGTQRSIPALWPLLDGDDERIADAAATALMRIRDDRVVRRAMQEAPHRVWARRALGIGGGPTAPRLLLDILKTSRADKDVVLALGLLGDLSAVMPLVDLLGHDGVGATAAIALNTITGAGLYGSTFVPDTFDPDELTDEEREAFERDGTVPTRKGEPSGSSMHGPVRDKAVWCDWLEQNKHGFSREHRWRMGQPYGPSALVSCLTHDTSPFAIRSATYEEFVVRYGLNVPFEMELPVQQQRHFLRTIETWVEAHRRTLPNGTGISPWAAVHRMERSS